MSSETTFSTKDLQLAAYLKARGHPLQRVDRRRHPRYMEFARTPELDADVRCYFADAPIGVQALFDSYRELKRLMYESA